MFTVHWTYMTTENSKNTAWSRGRCLLTSLLHVWVRFLGKCISLTKEAVVWGDSLSLLWLQYRQLCGPVQQSQLHRVWTARMSTCIETLHGSKEGHYSVIQWFSVDDDTPPRRPELRSSSGNRSILPSHVVHSFTVFLRFSVWLDAKVPRHLLRLAHRFLKKSHTSNCVTSVCGRAQVTRQVLM